MQSYLNASLTETAVALRTGTLSLLSYLEELEAHFNRREPAVLAFVPEDGRFRRLHHEAEQLLERYPDPAHRPPLFGLPVGVKDIFHVQGFETQAGCRLPAALLQGEEATSVTTLRQAGALILGKTVTTEFAYFAPGPTRNPHNPAHTPGGSSSGSAAAVGAGLCPFAFGTQTIGSINRPAAFCGVVGYKPSYDRISKAGVIPLAESVDHVGGFTTDVAGMVLAAGLLCRDWQTAVSTSQPTLGIPEGPYLAKATDESRAHFRQIEAQLRDAGWVVKSVPAMPDFNDINARHNLIVAAEAARFHAPWFADYGALYHWKTAELIQRGQQVTDTQLATALAGREHLRQTLIQLMDEHDVDVWLSPSAPGAAPKGLDSTGDPVMNLPWTHSGLPTVTLPAGVNEAGLPLGLQLIGRWYEDEKLLSFAANIEAALSIVNY